MPKLPTDDDWTDFRTPDYFAALKATARAFIALRRTLRDAPPQIYRTAVGQLAQAPMEFDGGTRRYERARYRLQSYEYGQKTHGEHPYTKMRTKELIAQAIDRADRVQTPEPILLKAVMDILDSRQTTCLMNDGDQTKKRGLIRSGDGFVERYLPVAIVDRKDGRTLTAVEVQALHAARQKRWEQALRSVG